MRYSVWNERGRSYDYFDTKEPSPIHAPSPSHVTASSKLGTTVEQAAWRLPAGAVRVGSGAEAMGRVASLGGGLEDVASPRTLAAVAICALILWKVMR